VSVDFAFIDSGKGGIPYMRRLLEICPAAECVYVGDSKNFPYGEKSQQEIINLVTDLCQKIIHRFDPKAIIVACNTMSVNALDELRETFPDVKFVGTVPAIKLASSLSQRRKIGLIASNSTVHNDYNQKLQQEFANDCTIISRGDKELISFIEKKAYSANKQDILDACKNAADFFAKSDVDVVVLGCTHFLNIKEEIQEAFGPDIKVVDSVDGVVKHALQVVDIDFFKQPVIPVVIMTDKNDL
jgi:glutamate racemase